jgi:hypothetical protein
MQLQPSNAGWTKYGYLVYIRTQRCSHCGRETTYSSVSEIFYQRHGSDRKAIPRTTRIEPGYPVERSKLPDETIPVCHACFADFNQAAAATPLDETRWAETLKRKAAEDEAPSPKSTAPRHTFPKNPTIEDL